MQYREFIPSLASAHFVRCYWTLEEEDACTYRPEPILPDGCPEIVFNLNVPFKRLYRGSLSDQPRTIVVGQMKHAVTVLPTGNVKLFGVRFWPFGLFPFVRESVGQLTDRIEPIAAIFGARGGRIESRIHEADGTGERILIFEEEFTSELATDWPISREVDYGVQRIAADPLVFRVRTLADELGINLKKLERSFTREIGLTPKYFARILRIQRLLGHLSEADNSSWTDTAYEFGFSDQSHFIREFKALTGSAPRSFASQEQMFASFFTDSEA